MIDYNSLERNRLARVWQESGWSVGRGARSIFLPWQPIPAALEDLVKKEYARTTGY